MSDYTPYDREEHRFVNKMTALLIKARLNIEKSTKTLDRIQKETERHIKHSIKRIRNGEKKHEESNISNSNPTDCNSSTS